MTSTQPQVPTYVLKIVIFTEVGTFSGALNEPTSDYAELEAQRAEFISRVENDELGAVTLVNERQMITVPQVLAETAVFAFEIIEANTPPISGLV